MAPRDGIQVKFWGVRGSVPCSGPETSKYGGNSSCVEIWCGDRRLILDAGTGIRRLGDTISGPERVDIFLSHCHYDHVIGLPFLGPLFMPGFECHIWAGHLGSNGGIGPALSDMLKPPLFPITFETFHADVNFHDFAAGETVEFTDDITLQTAPLNHPDGATGYRVNYQGRSICYVTDTGHVAGESDANILELIKDSDLFIYDSTYTDAEFARHGGFGHSTWQEGVRLADQAGVKTYAIFHHDPGHDDRFMDTVAAEAEQTRPGTLVARDGMVLEFQVDGDRRVI